jgi:tRNA (guanine-N(7)-)-methyltransferase
MEQVKSKYIPSFARRRSRKLSLKQEVLLKELLPNVTFSLKKLEELKNIYSSFAVEIGFGGGEHLIEQAIRNPNTLFIGIEPFINGVVKVLQQIESQDIKNILIYCNDAREILELLFANFIDVIFVLFPDPWPKNKHKKRRIINYETLKLIHSILKPAAKLVIATDHQDYAEHILFEVIHSKFFNWQFDALENLNTQPKDWVQTRYETKAITTDSRIYYYTFIKKS